MKKVFLLLLIAFSFNQVVLAQSDTYEPVADKDAVIKAFMLDIGYGGEGGLSAAIGFRYWFASLSVGLSGFAKDIPNYAQYDPSTGINPSQPLPNGYEEERYPAIILTADLGLHYDLNEQIGLFANVGVYSQQDTLIGKNYTNGNRYYWKYYNSSGLAFGGGVDYAFAEQLIAGIGYHTKRGVFARISYFWF